MQCSENSQVPSRLVVHLSQQHEFGNYNAPSCQRRNREHSFHHHDQAPPRPHPSHSTPRASLPPSAAAAAIVARSLAITEPRTRATCPSIHSAHFSPLLPLLPLLYSPLSRIYNGQTANTRLLCSREAARAQDGSSLATDDATVTATATVCERGVDDHGSDTAALARSASPATAAARRAKWRNGRPRPPALAIS